MARITPYDEKDLGLLRSKAIFTNFGKDIYRDHVELHIYSGENVLESDYNVQTWSIDKDDTKNNAPCTQLNIHGDIRSLGYRSGTFGIKYNFLRCIVGDTNNLLFIQEISNDRKEIRLRPKATDYLLGQDFLEFGERIEGGILSQHDFWPDVYLNFGEDVLLLAVNWAVDYSAYPQSPHSIVIKLYEPLPEELEDGDELWISQKVAESVTEDIKLTLSARAFDPHELAPPDYSIQVPGYEPPQPSGWETETSLLSEGDTTNKNRLFNKLFSGSFGDIRINIDWKIPQHPGDDASYIFKNVVHFGSVAKKLENFKYKLRQLESFTARIAEVSTDLIGKISSSATSSYHFKSNKLKWEGKKNEVIGNFDDFEEQLYYSSQSYVSNSHGEFLPFSWPKATTTTPYELQPVSSSAVKRWYGQIDNPTGDNYNTGVLFSASRYDEHNDSALINTVPAHIRFDENNDKYVDFVHMVGDNYDQLWLYTKHLLDIHSRKNPLYEGLPKKLLEPVLKSFGWMPYQSFDFDDLWSYNFGTDGSGSYGASEIPNTAAFTQSLTYAVGSQMSESFSKEDIGKELWKRLLNNLPHILKTKGTEESIRAVISTYGLPSTILKIHEYGGPQKLPGRHSKNIHDRFSYALLVDGKSCVTGSWSPVSGSNGKISYPNTIQLRFNIPDVIQNKKNMILWNTYSGSSFMSLQHTSSFSTKDSGSTYGRVNFGLRSGSAEGKYISCSTDWAPLYDNDWWSIMLTRKEPGFEKLTGYAFTSSNNLIDHDGQDLRYNLYCKKMSDFTRFGRINWAVSASMDISGSLGERSRSYNRSWGGFTTVSGSSPSAIPVASLRHFVGGASESFAGDSFLYVSGTQLPSRLEGFSGSLQEFRLWQTPLSESVFDYHVQSPISIAGNNVTSSYDELLVRWPFGADLLKYEVSHSMLISSSHPSQISRFYTGSTRLPTKGYLHGFDTSPGKNRGYSEEEERYYTLMPRSIGPSPYSEKIRIEDNKIRGNLHPIEKREFSSFDRNPLDSNKVGIFFSPTDEIDLDIAHELGPFEYDNFVGDPRDTYLSKYTQLKRLREHYWKKHSGNPNFFEFLRMVRYFDDSLFRTVRQLIPARAKGQVGLLVKPHLLERPRILKYPSASRVGYKIDIHEPHKFDQVVLEGHISITDSASFTGYSAGESGPFTYTGLRQKKSSNNRQGTRAGGYMLTPSHSNAQMQKNNFNPKNQAERDRGLDNRTVGELEGDYKWDKFGYDIRGYGSRYIHTTVEFPSSTAGTDPNGARVWNAYYKRDGWGMTIHTPPNFYIHGEGNYDAYTASAAPDITDGYVKWGLNRKNHSEQYVPFIGDVRKSFERYKHLHYYANEKSQSLGKAIPERHIRNWGNPLVLGGTGHIAYAGARIPSGSMPSHSLSESAEYQDFKQTPCQNLYWHGCKLIGSDFNMESAQTIDGGPVVEYYDVSPYKYIASDEETADGKLLTAGEGIGERSVQEMEAENPVGRRYERPPGQNLRGGTTAPNNRLRG